MRRLRRIMALTGAERRLVVRALSTVSLARMAIWFLPLASARRIVDRWAPRIQAAPITKLTWAVTASSRFVPGANCLVQAVAAQALLTRAGYKSRMEIGVRREAASGFEAHAWVICEDQIVIGGATAERFTRLGYGGM